MVAEQRQSKEPMRFCCSLAKISMVAEHVDGVYLFGSGCSLAKISMVAEQKEDKS